MSNTIKLKRGSGSDPSANDLVVGELAIRTDSGKIFTKKDNGTVAEISGGGAGLEDGDKGDITVSNGGDTFTIDNGVIDNANIASNAAIAGSKISPNFTSITESGIQSFTKSSYAAPNSTNFFRLKFGDFGGVHNDVGIGQQSNQSLDFNCHPSGTFTFNFGTTGESLKIDDNGQLTLTSTDSTSNASPVLELYRNSASPADADYLGQIKFTGEDAADNKQVYAKITGKADDVTNATEDGILEFMLTKAGSNNIAARFTSTDFKLINGTGLEVAGDTALSGDLEISSTVPTINFVDTNNDSDFSIKNENGVFKIVDTTNSTTRFQIISSGITNIEAPLNVNGNFITNGTGTVNGGNLTVSGTAPFLRLNDTDNNPDYRLFNIGGVFQIFDETNSEVRLKVSTSGNIQIPADNKKFEIGASNDLQLFHDSNDSIINDAGTGNLKLQTGGSTKFETTSSGVKFTGVLEAADNQSILLGTSQDFRIRHTGSHSEITDEGTGNLRLGSNQTEIRTANLGTLSAKFVGAGAVELNHNGTKKFETSSTGVAVTGSINGTVSSANADILTLTANMGTNNGRALVFSAPDTDSGSQPFTIATGNALEVDIDNARTLFIDDSGQVNLHHDGSTTAKLSTSSTGVSVTGNITVTGTVDGVNIAERNTLFGGLTSSSGVLTNGVTATTQSAGNNTTRVATTAFVSTAIANLIDSSPSTLNTLNELASALGDDPNFATTVTNSIATKLPLAGGTLTGNLTIQRSSGTSTLLVTSTDDYATLEIGGSTGAFIDLKSPASDDYDIRFVHSGHIYAKTNITLSPTSGNVVNVDRNLNALEGLDVTGDITCSEKLTLQSGNLEQIHRSWTNTSDSDIYGLLSGSTFGTIVEGANNGHHVVALRDNDSNDSFAIISGGGNYQTNDTFDKLVARFRANGSTVLGGDLQLSGNITIENSAPEIFLKDSNNNDDFTIRNNNGVFTVRDATNGVDRFTIESDGHANFTNRIDALGGIAVTNNISVSGTVDGRDVGADGTKLDGIESGATADQTASEILTLIKTVDGAGSGLDADTLDGISSASFLRSDAADTASANITINGAEVGAWSGGTTYKGLFHTSHNNSEYMIINNDGHTFISATTGSNVYIRAGGNSSSNQFVVTTSGATIGGNSVLTSASSLNASNLGSGTIPSARLSASDLLTLIKTVDGSGSGLDADTLDGLQLSSTATANTVVQRNANGYIFSNYINTTDNSVTSGVAEVMVKTTGGGDYHRSASAGAIRTFINVENGATADQSASEILTLIKTVDGSGSGLDADTVDGIQGANFVRSDTSDAMSGSYNVTGQFLVGGNFSNNSYNSVSSTRLLFGGGNDPNNYHIGTNLENFSGNFSKLDLRWHTGIRMGAQSVYGGVRIYNSEDLGSVIFSVNKGDGNVRIESGELYHNTSGTSDKYWREGNDGSGSGLDADLLDGVQGASFARSDADDTMSGSITFSKDAVDVINFSANSTNLNRGIAFNSKTALSAHYNDGWLRINNNSEFTNGVFTPLKIRADQGFHVGGTTIIDGNAQVIASRLTGALPAIDGSNLTGISAGATGGGSDEVFYENGQTVTTDYTITNGKNAMAAGPITINSGVTVTVGSGENLTIV